MKNDTLLFNRNECEFLRFQAKQRFDKIRGTWIDCGKWAQPHRIKWMLSQTEGERNNHIITDATHILALRSYVSGFLEGNTSATRPWFRIQTADPELNKSQAAKEWLQAFTDRCVHNLYQSNFYNAAPMFYADFGTFNTGAYYIDEFPDHFYFHNLDPGSYFIVNNGYKEPIVMVREFSLTVKALVDTYAKKGMDGQKRWDNITQSTRTMYENGNYTQMVMIVHIIKENDFYDANKPENYLNRKWLSVTYEVGGNFGGQYYQAGEFGSGMSDPVDFNRYLKISSSRRKPFIVGKAESSSNYEYGEKGPTLDALGLIKSANKKALGKDQALEHMLRPPLQGPSNLKKSYLTSAPNHFIPLDATSSKPGGGMRSVFEINPAIQYLVQDVTDIRQQIDKIYFVDYLLYLSQNPRTRTATETNAIVQEQQLVIGPNLQSLNWTHNVPLLDWVMDWTLHEDPYLPPPPKDLQGRFLRPEFISVFAQAQKAADLPSVERYLAFIEQVGQLNPKIWDKVNLDKIADTYEDRLFLPVGINNPQGKVDAQRKQAEAMAQRQQMLQETLPAVAKAAKDSHGLTQPQGGGQ